MKKMKRRIALLLVICLLQMMFLQAALADPDPGTVSPTETVTPAPGTPEPTAAPTLVPTPVPTPVPTNSPTPTEVLAPTEAPSPTIEASVAPTKELPITFTPTPDPNATETPEPTGTGTPTPTPYPYEIVVPPDKEENYNIKKTDKAASVGQIPLLQIDGVREALWDLVPEYTLQNLSLGEEPTVCSFRVMWTKQKLLLFVVVMDATPDCDSELISRRDSIEIFLNESGQKPPQYGVGDQHYKIDRNGLVVAGSGGNAEGFTGVVTEIEGGYTLEAAIDFQMITGEYGTTIGFDLRVNDSYGTGMRDVCIQWSDTSLYTHLDLSKIGSITLR